MKRMVAAGIVSLLLAGCGERSAQAPEESMGRGKLYADMATNDVVVVVNGKSLTKGDIERQVAVQCELLKMAKPSIKVNQLERSLDMLREKAEGLFIEREVMVEYAKKHGVTVTSEDRKAIRERFAKSVLKGRRAMYGVLSGKLTAEQRAELDQGLDYDFICQKANELLRKESAVETTDADTEKKYRELEAYNKRAQAKEDETWRQATNVWKRIQSGEDFEKAAKRGTEGIEHASYDMDWGEYEYEFFTDEEELTKYLKTMPVGTVCPPVPGDGGVMIVKLLGRIAPHEMTGKPKVQIARIFYALPELYPLKSKDDLRRELSDARNEKAFKEAVNRLEGEARIEYPNGMVEVTMNKAKALHKCTNPHHHHHNRHHSNTNKKGN